MNTTQTTKRGNGTAGRTMIQCPRCSGSGRIKAFGHVSGGVCFLCDGTGRAEVTAFSKVWEWDGAVLRWDGSGISVHELCSSARADLLANAHYMYLGGGPDKRVASTPWNMAHLAAMVLATRDAAVEARAVAALAKLDGDVTTFRAVLDMVRDMVAECR